jgi:CRP-like cAMP-binding protein
MNQSRHRAKDRHSGPAVAATPTGNLLLAGLPSGERQRIIARCEPVQLELGQVLYEPGARIRHVYFPTSSFISLISSIDRNSRLEVGLVGTEGMLGISVMLGLEATTLEALVQGAGMALRMSTAHFSLELKRSPVLVKLLSRYLHVLMSQLSQMAACTRFHIVEERLARWLLMTRDRAHSNEFRLTQEFIAFMLGVRRAGITRAATALQKRKLIRYSRGNVTILNGRGLEAASCACYAAATQVYSQSMQ